MEGRYFASWIPATVMEGSMPSDSRWMRLAVPGRGRGPVPCVGAPSVLGTEARSVKRLRHPLVWGQPCHWGSIRRFDRARSSVGQVAGNGWDVFVMRATLHEEQACGGEPADLACSRIATCARAECGGSTGEMTSAGHNGSCRGILRVMG
jgi:hypothetical protein